MQISKQEASAIFDEAFAKSGRKTVYWNEKETAVAAIMEGREAYLSKLSADNHWAYNCAHQSSGGPDHEDRRYASLRDWLERQDWLPVESLETRLDWIIPLNEAAANALYAEYSRLGTFREAVTSKPGFDGRSFIDARSSQGWAA